MTGITLQEARERLLLTIEKGGYCPCCGQYAKVYKRSITSSMAYGLSLLTNKYLQTKEPIHIEDYLKSLDVPSSIRGDITKLRYWGLIESQEVGLRQGYYRVTLDGINFALGMTVVPKYAVIYNDQVLRLEGKKVSIIECSGNKFSIKKLEVNHE